MVEDKLTFRLIKNEEKVDIIIFNLESKFLFKIINVSCNIKLQVTISAIHLMFPDSLWIINVVQYAFAPASISSGSATHQGTLSYFYPMRTRKYYRRTYVLHPSRTSSVTKQTETSLKIYFSISETNFPSNNFAENPRKFPGIFPGNPRKFPGIFHRKIR